ncbi:hypothetical protein [Trueperella pyogenes]|uniref:hypothetical protein n=1 Tax=Trueperella pyogenes TaxID=1661 RepID=UPI003F533710
MARLAQGLQVLLIVCAATIERKNVVNLGGRRDASVPFALFTRRVGGDVSR